MAGNLFAQEHPVLLDALIHLARSIKSDEDPVDIYEAEWKRHATKSLTDLEALCQYLSASREGLAQDVHELLAQNTKVQELTLATGWRVLVPLEFLSVEDADAYEAGFIHDFALRERWQWVQQVMRQEEDLAMTTLRLQVVSRILNERANSGQNQRTASDTKAHDFTVQIGAALRDATDRKFASKKEFAEWVLQLTGVSESHATRRLTETGCYVPGKQGRRGSGLGETIAKCIAYALSHG